MALSRADALRLKVDVDAQKAKQELDSFAAKTEATGKRAAAGADKATNSFASMRAAMVKVGVATAAISAAVVAIDRFAKKAQEIEGVTKGFDVLTKRVGESSDAMLQRMRPAARGLISDMGLMKQANNAIILGLPVTADSMGELTDAAVKLGNAMGVTADKSLESLIVGIGRQSKLWLDNIGIVVDADAAYQKMADSLGMNVSELTDAQRKLAFYEETLRAAREASDGLSVETNTLSGKWEQATTAVGNFLDKMVEVINLAPKLRFNGVGFGLAAPTPGQGRPRNTSDKSSSPLGSFGGGVDEGYTDQLAKLEELRLKAIEAANALFAVRTGQLVTPGGSAPVGPGSSPTGSVDTDYGSMFDPVITGAGDAKIALDELTMARIRDNEAAIEHSFAIAAQWEQFDLLTGVLGHATDALWDFATGQAISARAVLQAISKELFGKLSAIAIENVILGLQEQAKAAAAAASFNYVGAALHQTASSLHFATAAKAGAGAAGALAIGAASAGGGSSGGGGGGGGASSSVSSTGSPASSSRPQEVTVVIEGQGIIYASPDEVARIVSEAINKQNSRAGI